VGFAKRREVEDPTLNLIPVMNLFVALIPFLLLSAVFFHMRVIKGSVPAATEGETDIAKGDETVTMTVQVDPKDGYHVTASSATLPPDIVDKLGRSIKKKGDEYDTEELGKFLRGIKRKWPKSDTVIIVPDPTVKYRELVDTMDASREIEIEMDGKTHHYIMFSRVVVSSLVT